MVVCVVVGPVPSREKQTSETPLGSVTQIKTISDNVESLYTAIKTGWFW